MVRLQWRVIRLWNEKFCQLLGKLENRYEKFFWIFVADNYISEIAVGGPGVDIKLIFNQKHHGFSIEQCDLTDLFLMLEWFKKYLTRCPLL